MELVAYHIHSKELLYKVVNEAPDIYRVITNDVSSSYQ
jgi:hypothetical protein